MPEESLMDFSEETVEEYNPEKDRAEIIKTLVNALRITEEDLLNLLTNSDLVEKHAPILSNGLVLDSMGTYYGEPLKYNIWILKFLQARLSKGRMSRIEILRAAETMNEGAKSDEDRERRKFMKIFSRS